MSYGPYLPASFNRSTSDRVVGSSFVGIDSDVFTVTEELFLIVVCGLSGVVVDSTASVVDIATVGVVVVVGAVVVVGVVIVVGVVVVGVGVVVVGGVVGGRGVVVVVGVGVGVGGAVVGTVVVVVEVDSVLTGVVGHKPHENGHRGATLGSVPQSPFLI